MTENEKDLPECFAQLNKVFPVGEEGIRTTPSECMKCPLVKPCIQAAMRGHEGLKLEGDRVDRAYEYGLIGKLERWSKKKLIHQQIEAMTSKAKTKEKEK
jgi:hypothetical protein